MKKILSFSLISFILFNLVSCGNDKLTNEQAMEILKRDYKEVCFSELRTKGILDRFKNTKEKKSYKLFMSNSKELENLGLIKLSIRNRQNLYTSYQESEIKFNNRAKIKYQIKHNKAIVANAEVMEIIGISQSDKSETATVRFKVDFKPTPFNKIKYSNNKCVIGTIEKEIELKKFDTGWKIK